jgi:hypothetical protein
VSAGGISITPVINVRYVVVRCLELTLEAKNDVAFRTLSRTTVASVGRKLIGGSPRTFAQSTMRSLAP